MKKLLLLCICLALLSFAPQAMADAPALQVNPLQYSDTLVSGKVKLGYVEVANPSDTTIALEADVQGFRQIGTDGKLSFFQDPEIAAGIRIDLPKFSLGPREAVRVAFTVDPGKLPIGGVYAVIFFRTIPPAQISGSSYVAESANIGTLLMLQNGGSGAHAGEITSLKLPFWQFGRGLVGSLMYRNVDRSKTAIGFSPDLSSRVLPWGKSLKLATRLILPGSERKFAIERPGSYFGLLPVTITDTQSSMHKTGWVIACTGWYQLAFLIIGLASLIAVLQWRRIWSKR